MSQSSLNHRVRQEIDGRSYIQTYHLDGTQDFVLFIHGILGHYEETWKDTPVQLMAESALSAADFGSFGYATRIFDTRTTQSSALQLTTWMRTHLSRYERIYVIAHSMGGLITREACGYLARSQHSDDRRLLGKIRHGFFVAVPIAGSTTAGFLRRFPVVRWLNKKIEILSEPRVAGQHLHDFYEESIRLLEPAAPRPRFSLFTGSEDGLVSAPPEWVLTADDRHEGVIEGNHSTIKFDLSANSTLVRRIVQLIGEHQAAPAAAIVARPAPEAPGKPRDVLIFACSMSKSSVNLQIHHGTGTLLDSMTDPDVRAAAVRCRTHIKSLMESGRLEGVEFKEGNRKFRPQNTNLLLGPDFGGIANGPRYAPAYRRYMGRSFQATAEEWERFLAMPEDDRPSVLIVSGLYGLCRIDEPIQNYDCHLSDVDMSTGRSLHDLWRPVLTDMLASHLAWLRERGREGGRVLNLVAENPYSDAIDWARISEQAPVWHQRFASTSGRDSLENVGVWIRGVVARPSSLERLSTGIFYDDPQFTKDDRCWFEEQA